MGSPKLGVTADGRITSVAYTNDTKLPPMILVGINDALADVPLDATWLSKTDYKFEHVVSADEMKKADFIEYVLRWIACRLDAGGATMNADATGPLHGYLREAWKSQEPIILDWSDDPNGLEEQWAQLYSELFSGINYDGTGTGYKMGEGAEKSWDEYIFSRLQSEYQEHATFKKQSERIGRSVESWENPQQHYVSEKEYNDRAWKTNDDPASPLCCACQYLATFGLITRGFRIEYAKKELQYMRGVVGLSAAPANGYTNVLHSWVWRDDKPVKEIAPMMAESPPLTPGSVYTYHAYHQLASVTVSVKVVKKVTTSKTIDPIKKTEKIIKVETPVRRLEDIKTKIEILTGWQASKLKEAIAAVEQEEAASFPNDKQASDNLELGPVNIGWTGQPGGSHIHQLLRIHKDKTRVQLFDASGGSESRGVMEAEKDGGGRPLGRGLALEAGLLCNMDSCAYSSIYKSPNGVGIPKPAPDLEKQIETMKKARPIGLARLVLTERKPTTELGPEHVLFVSKLMRTYGDADHQNYTITRYLWSLRNTPGFSTVQPWWFIFLPIGVLARCMWAVGSRSMKLADFMAKHAGKAPNGSSWFRFGGDGGLSLGVNYCESQILTNIAGPSFPGRSKIIRRVKSEPVFPNSARLVAEGMTRLPPAFTQALPGAPAPRNMILPANGDAILAWDFVYVRADIEGGDAVRALSGSLLDYFREG